MGFEVPPLGPDGPQEVDIGRAEPEGAIWAGLSSAAIFRGIVARLPTLIHATDPRFSFHATCQELGR